MPRNWFVVRGPLALLAGVLLACPVLAADPAYYHKQATWQETLVAAREALAQQEAAQQPGAAADQEQWGPWYAIGTFRNGDKSSLTEVFPPEQTVDLARGVGNLKWQAHAEWIDGVVHQLIAGENTATYLYRTVTVKSPRTITGYFGSDDGMAFFLNGKRLILRDVPRGAGPNQDQAALDLVAGENQLLFKIHNHSGDCGFYFSTSPTPGGADNPAARSRAQLWSLVERDFADSASRREMAWERAAGVWDQDWPAGKSDAALAERLLRQTPGGKPATVKPGAKPPTEAKVLDGYRKNYYRAKAVEEATAKIKDISPQALRLAIEDLIHTYGDKYAKGADYLKRLEEIEQALMAPGSAPDQTKIAELGQQLGALREEALLANPLLQDFDKLLLVRRSNKFMGLPTNWQGNSSLPKADYDNEIAVLSPVNPQGKLTTLYKPEINKFAGNLCLHWNADKLLFSMPGSHDRYQVFEIGMDGKNLRQVTPTDLPDVDNYDATYLPNGRIVFCSTMCFAGVPCVGGADSVGNLCIIDADGKNLREVCFDQDHNWCPTVLNNGQVMYTRWEYSDTPHYFSRLLFRMNPDGSGQFELYGSNSYWPNSIFYARAIPNDPSKVVAVISGHHGSARVGELILFDPDKGRRETDGVVQRIPGYGKKVEPLIRDGLVDPSWPKFLHPCPLSDKYFLVACQPTPRSNWGIYLVDVFDNMVCLAEQPGYALLEPVAVQKRPVPPVIPDRVDPKKKDASVYIADIYRGDGMTGVPRGTVKSLRISEPYFAYRNMGGHQNIGLQGPWDVHRILGTVPVEEDGSASFKVPANAPITIQPLDGEGKAVQLMRSWYTVAPGEVVACAGCHEQQTSTPPTKVTQAARRPPSELAPWHGPARGFSFKRDVQPVLDQYCVGCHDGQARTDGKKVPDFSAKSRNGWGGFTPSYLALHPYVRRPGPESDYHLLKPMEYHADTSELIQMLQKGHYNVKLDAEAWDRLVTWIDLNVPDHGTWGEQARIPANFHERRLEMRTQFAGRPEDYEAIPALPKLDTTFVKPAPMEEVKQAKIDCPNWPFSAEQAKKMQAAAGPATKQTIELGGGVKMELVLVPAGAFVMGGPDGAMDERALARVKIDRPFWMGALTVTNQQYQRFDPKHDNAYISQHSKDHTSPGYSIQAPNMPAVRVSWQEAMDYCRWLAAATGKRCTLPTEAQWEWACRAGTATPFWYGDLNTDFAPYANLGDISLRLLAVQGVNPQPIPNPNDFMDFLPKEVRCNDHQKIMCDAGQYQANPWGLFDMHGNAAQWTRSTYQPYPYNAADGRDDAKGDGLKVVRGGSWYDRPYRATSSYRLAYRPWQPVYNVGFRVVCEVEQVAQR